MTSVFVVWHTHEENGNSDEKVIGIYASRPDAEAAILRLSNKPGFKDASDGFEISEYILEKTTGRRATYLRPKHLRLLKNNHVESDGCLKSRRPNPISQAPPSP